MLKHCIPSFEGISDPLALVNPDCSLEITNNTYREWVAKELAQCLQRNATQRIAMPILYALYAFLRRQKGKEGCFEYWEDYDEKFYYIHLYPIFDDEGDVIKAVHYVKDITDKKQIEEHMRRAEKLAAIGQLSSGVAHEINNPLGGIKLCFNNLITTEMDDETRRTHVKVINSGLERIQDIVKQLLDFSKKTSLSVSPRSINNLIDGVLKLTEYLISEKKN